MAEEIGTPELTETDFEALSTLSLEEDSDSPEPESVVEEAPAVPVAEPVAATVVAPVPAAVEPVKPVEPVAKAPEAPAVVAPPASETQQPAAPSGMPTTEQMLQRRNTLLSELSSRYTVSEVDAERLMTEPHKVLPEMAARNMLDSFDASVTVIASMLPKMIEDVVQRQTQADTAQKAFFEQWPQLAKPELAPEIQRVAAMYRQLNPKVPLKKALSDIGALVATTLGLPLQPVAPVQNAPAPVMRPVPFVPGGAGSTPGGSAQPAAVNEFARLALLNDED